MKQVDYVLICEVAVFDLVNEVQKYLALGWRCQGGIGWAEPVYLQAMVRMEEQAVPEPSEDTKRMDWLEAKGFSTTDVSTSPMPGVFRWNNLPARWTATGISNEFSSCRAAIDAAMAKEEQW